MSWKRFVVVIVALVACAAPLLAQESVSSKLALTPPMGWNSWNKFGCNVSDAMIRQMADSMV